MISTSLFSIDAMSAVRGRWIIKVAHIVPAFRIFIFHSPTTMKHGHMKKMFEKTFFFFSCPTNLFISLFTASCKNKLV